jgi:hypothetical protein
MILIAVMMCVAAYLLIFLAMLVALTYLDVKVNIFYGNDEIIKYSFIWPLSIPVLIVFGIGSLCDTLIDRLRNYFNKGSK